MSKSAPTWKIVWHARDFVLSGVALVRAAEKEAAIELMRRMVMTRHDMVIVIDRCKRI